MRGVRAICCALALAMAFLVTSARADEYTKQTFLTFSGPVQLPGVTLPAGTYMFKLADPEGGRRTLQVWDKDATHLFTMLLTIPDERMEPSDKPVVMFSERPSGEAQAVKAWFYPGDRIGQEFVYPKDQAMKIARENHASVLAFSEDNEKANDAAAMHTAKVERFDENGRADNTAANTTADQDKPAASTTTASSASTTTAPSGASASTLGAPPAATAPSANRTNAAPSTTAANSQTSPHPSPETAARRAEAAGTQAVGTSGQSNNATAPGTLPRTASPLALVELLSGLTIAAGVGVRQLRKRHVESRG